MKNQISIFASSTPSGCAPKPTPGIISPPMAAAGACTEVWAKKGFQGWNGSGLMKFYGIKFELNVIQWDLMVI